MACSRAITRVPESGSVISGLAGVGCGVGMVDENDRQVKCFAK
jgi:hypothetical protein